MKLENGTNCWIPNGKFGWLSATVNKVEFDTNKGSYRIELRYDDDRTDDTNPIVIHTKELNETDEKLPKLKNIDDTVDDLTTLPHLNEPSVLNSVKLRYQKKIIYTFSGVVLIAMNPFEKVEQLYTSSMICAYRNAQMSDNPPHLFAIANESYKSLRESGRNQSIIVSGESGAGKTVSARYIMRFFASVHANGRHSDTTQIENQILATNPIMEAFGNAKTIRNDNSSRFGKYLRISFNREHVICGAIIQTYLLERSRLVYQAPHERNYHIFYQMLKGLPEEMMKEFGLLDAKYFHYLYQGDTTEVRDVDDKEEFNITCCALETIGLDKTKRYEVFKILAALLHIGNINIENFRNEAVLDNSDPHLTFATELLGLSKQEFAKWIIKKKISTRSDNIASSLKFHEAIVARDSISKYLYSMLFDWLVRYINNDLSSSEPNSQEEGFIGVLDIYGFEHFDTNSFEQFCINYANEKLQQEFTHHVFKLQQEEYVKEGIEWSFITYLDNQPCIDLIENNDGIISLLDEQCTLPSGSDNSWAEKMFHMYKSTPYNKVFKKARFGNDKFVVSHYALGVSYNVDGFIEKNRDSVSDAQNEILKATKNSFLREILKVMGDAASFATENRTRNIRNNKKPTLGSIFKKSLNELMATINSTDAHYIRCIKPNEQKVAWMFDNPMVLSQLRACGVLETIRISLLGFPSKYTYQDFVQRFKILLNAIDLKMIQTTVSIDSTIAKKLSMKLLTSLIEDKQSYQAGKTKLFFRSGVLGQLEIHKANKLNTSCIIIQKNIRAYLARKIWNEARTSLVRTQSLIRGNLIRDRLDCQISSIIYVQSLCRKWKTVNNVKNLIYLITILQSHFRGIKSRADVAELEEKLKKEKLKEEHLRQEKLLQEKFEQDNAQNVINEENIILKKQEDDREKMIADVRLLSPTIFPFTPADATPLDIGANNRTENTLTKITTDVVLEEHAETGSFTSRSTTLIETAKDTEKDREKWIKILACLPPDVTKESIVGMAPPSCSKLLADQVVKKMKNISDKVDGMQIDDPENIFLTTRIKASLKNDIESFKHIARRAKHADPDEIITSKRNVIADSIVFDKGLSIQEHLDRSFRSSYADLKEYMNSSNIAPNLTASLLLSQLESPIDDSRVPVEMGELVYPSRLVNLLLMNMWSQGFVDQATIFLERCLNIFKSELVHEDDIENVINKGTYLLNNVNRIRLKIATERNKAIHDFNTEVRGIERKKYLKMLLIVKRFCDTTFGQMYHLWMGKIFCDLDKKLLHAIAVDDTVYAVQQNAHKYFKYMIQRGAKYKMLDLIHIFNNVYLSLKINGFDEDITKSVLKDLLTYVDVTAFNKLMKNPQFLNISKSDLMKSNMSILLEWCTDRHITDAPTRLMHILTLSQVLQIKSLGLAKVDSLMEHTQDLTMPQLRRIIEESENYTTWTSEKSHLGKDTEIVDDDGLKNVLIPVDDGMFESMPLKML
ncbi:hypothetical protein CANINC_001413 [Pichia inconspicua]|uniref:Myosin motor domain-containing protein n=1 Tax=Pichia inconspicua TaxID=52247 RepID=A0A4T0X5G8_9ASCO|nr:hypothetical protein CANINC_001413 [[Candida] inconspicua]